MHVSKSLPSALLRFSLILTTGMIVGCLSSESSVEEEFKLYPSPNEGDSASLSSSMNKARGGHVAVRLQNGKVLVLGGIPLGFSGVEKSEIYNPANNKWKNGPEPVVSNRHWARGVLLNDGRVLIVGGETIDNSNGRPAAVKDIEVYDPDANEFRVVGVAANPRGGASVTKLADGRVLILGGCRFDFNIPALVCYRDGEIFDPTTNQLHAIANTMSVGRAGHSATLMTNGNVLISGGTTSSGVTGLTEIFQTSTRTLVQTNNLQSPRSGHFSALLPNGNVVIVGGSDAPAGIIRPLVKVEAYEPNGSFSYLPELPKKGYTAGVMQLSDARIVVSGGDEVTNGALRHDSVFIYDLESNEFYLNTHLSEPRSEHTITELNDGSLLVVGGFTTGNGWNYAKTSERLKLLRPAFATVDTFSLVPGYGVGGRSIAADALGTIYVVGTDTSVWHWVIRKSNDGGNTWSTIMPIEPATMTSGIANAVAADSLGTVYVAGTACNQVGNSGGCNSLLGLVRKSIDGGQTWSTVDSYPAGGVNGLPYGPVSMAIDSSDNIYVAGSAGVRVSTNGGLNWTTLDAGSGIMPTAIAVSASGKIFVAGHNGFQWRVRKSAGLNSPWTAVDSFTPNSPADFAVPKTIVVDAVENVYVGGFQGVRFPSCFWCSAGWLVRKGAASGTQWTTVDELPYDTIQNGDPRISWATAMAVDDKGRIFVAGSDGNKWLVKMSRNTGSTWNTIDDFLGAWGPSAIGIVNKKMLVTGQAGDWKTRRLDLSHF